MKMNGHVYGLLLLLVAFVLVSCGEDSFLNRRDELPVDENAGEAAAEGRLDEQPRQ